MPDDWKAGVERLLRENPVGGASVSIWQHGQELLTLHEGWPADALVPVFSATKPASALCLLLALHDSGHGPELEVGELWPAFPAPRCTIGQLLSHQCGLAALAESAPLDNLDACRAAIERSSPAWLPPQHGYHPQTFGPLVDILMLELTGQRVAGFWEQRVRRPHGLDFFISLPESEFHRVQALQPPRVQARLVMQDAFYQRFYEAGSAVYCAFHSITGFDSPRAMSTPAAWQCGSPAKGGVASARGVAQFYQLLISDRLPVCVREWLATPQCRGRDATMLQETAFTCGAMCEPLALFPGHGFGHPGAGGSHGYCSPTTGLSFAYVMNRMELGVLPGPRVMDMLRLLPSA